MVFVTMMTVMVAVVMPVMLIVPGSGAGSAALQTQRRGAHQHQTS
jgi:hypothetical protein